jgi:hypothetical protein
MPTARMSSPELTFLTGNSILILLVTVYLIAKPSAGKKIRGNSQLLSALITRMHLPLASKSFLLCSQSVFSSERPTRPAKALTWSDLLITR